MSSGKAIDFGRRSQDYVDHRPGFPASFYDRLQAFCDLRPATALDVGSGPGIVAMQLAKRGASVTGLDISEGQIAAGKARAQQLGLTDKCSLVVARAERTGLAEHTFDLAIAGQCWHWFDEPSAISEMLRVLKPAGVLVVAHYSYLPRHSEVARLTEQLILERNPTWTMANQSGMYPQHIDALVRGGFDLVEQFCYHHQQTFTHEAWRGRVRTCSGVGSGSMSEVQVQQFDEALNGLLKRQFPDQPMQVTHRVWATVVRKPTNAPTGGGS